MSEVIFGHLGSNGVNTFIDAVSIAKVILTNFFAIFMIKTTNGRFNAIWSVSRSSSFKRRTTTIIIFKIVAIVEVVYSKFSNPSTNQKASMSLKTGLSEMMRRDSKKYQHISDIDELESLLTLDWFPPSSLEFLAHCHHLFQNIRKQSIRWPSQLRIFPKQRRDPCYNQLHW